MYNKTQTRLLNTYMLLLSECSTT